MTLQISPNAQRSAKACFRPFQMVCTIAALQLTLFTCSVVTAGEGGAAVDSGAETRASRDDARISADGDATQFTPIRVLPKMRPNNNFPIVDAVEASKTVLNDELVLGVEINGESRAYPLNMINGPFREILNDELAGTSIAVTWCFLCHNGIVYERLVGTETLTFSVSGLLWQRNLVMVDEESESLWSHMLGRAMRGEFEGTVLKRIPAEMTTWKKWKSQYPHTTVAILRRTSQRFQRDIYRLPERFVIGYEKNGSARAWGFADLIDQRVVNDEIDGSAVLIVFDAESFTATIFEREVDGKTLTFEWHGDQLIDRESGRIWDPFSGKLVGNDESTVAQLHRAPGVIAFGSAWKRFYPHSTYWGHKIDFGPARDSQKTDTSASDSR